MYFLVTGSSTGIGEACARRLDGRGHVVFAGVRREEDARRLQQGSHRLRPVLLDVTDAASVRCAVEEIERQAGAEGLAGVVNNAGIAVAGPLEYVPLDALRRQLEVNVVGQVAVTQAVLPLLRRAKGRIVLMGSISGRFAAPFLAPYSASKFALKAIADALRVELQPWNLHVAIVEPGSIATPIWSKSVDETTRMLAGVSEGVEQAYGGALTSVRRAAEETGRRGASPETVAAAVEHALLSPRPKTRYLVGTDARIQAVLAAVLPDRVRDYLIARALRLPR